MTEDGGRATGLVLWKYALALLGLAVMLYGNRVGQDWLSYAGLGLIVLAFFLRFVRRPKGPPDAG